MKHKHTPTPGFNHKIPKEITTPDSVEARLGRLKFFDATPDKATVEIVAGKSARTAKASLSIAVLALMLGFGGALSGARADEADARKLFKAMSDYMAAQKVISFQYEADLEIVTKDKQKLMLASSGKITLNRPNKARITRTSGFADVEFLFDGKTMTLLNKTQNVYGQLEVPGTIDQMIDELRDKYQRPVSGADLLLSDVYDKLMDDVVNVKDLGSGVIGGVECDHFAFRKKEVDFQIWIAQGSRPYPCRYVITSTQVDQAPQYSATIWDWKTGEEVGSADFSFKNATNAKKMDMTTLPQMDELPEIFSVGGKK
jgi:hypothetical protein